MFRVPSLVLMLLMLAGCGGGALAKPEPVEANPTPTVAPPPTAQAAPTDADGKPLPGPQRYAELVAEAKVSITGIDLRELRLAYLTSDHYSMVQGDEITAGFAALKAKDWATATRLAEQELGRNFASLDGHFIAYVAARESGDSGGAAYHDTVLHGLVDSIRQGHKGSGPDDAFFTITTPELYTFLGLSGYEVANQSLVEDKGRMFDVMDVIDDETKEKRGLWFDITLQMAVGESRLFGR